MDEYPNPDEEYELLYQEEMEALREMEEEALKEQSNSKSKRSKNSLNFDSPSKTNKESICSKNPENNEDLTIPLEDNTTVAERNKKRWLSTESLTEFTSDLEIVTHQAKKHKSDTERELKSYECGTTSLRIPKWPFFSISTDLGDKLYVKLINNNLNDDLYNYATSHRSRAELLVTPYNKLKILAEETLNNKNKEAENSFVDDKENSFEKSDLWVEQYKPKTYFDLLSDEAVNRTLLNWLKLWDKIVFNKEVKSRPVNASENKINMINELDKDGRPRYKTALLCGPPGLGKTTLAHIAAALAGYNVIEVNASDERTTEALHVKLEAATQIQSVMGNCKPHCLILDEIDGAPATTVEFLLKYVNGKVNEKSKKGKKDKPKSAIRRPIICICNELYTPSLRQLRQEAFVIHFPHTSSSKLAQRLLEICRKQDIKTDLSTLTLLCDKAQNDIRSCISTLHFFKNNKGVRFKSADVIKSTIGQKDIQKGIFSMWKEIFQVSLAKGNFFSNLINKRKEEEISSHINYSKKGMDKLQFIVQLIQSAGDYDRLVQGVFENFPKSKFSGSANSMAWALEWFSWFDLLDSNIRKEQNFILMPYLPYCFAAWHCLFSSSHFWKISYPSASFENHIKEVRCKQILNDVLGGLNAPVRCYNPGESILLDVLPMFNVILVPSMRSVNPALFNEDEKKDFKQLIDVMIEYGLNFVQQRSADGTYCYQYDPYVVVDKIKLHLHRCFQLSMNLFICPCPNGNPIFLKALMVIVKNIAEPIPNIDELSRFNVTNSLTTRSLSYNMRQVISHEVELERLRKAEENLRSVFAGNVERKKCDSDVKSKKRDVEKEPAVKPKEKNVKEEVQYKDFFGRVVTVRDTTAGKKAVADGSNPVKSPIWFNFKEGYNNAVKKDITMEDIL